MFEDVKKDDEKIVAGDPSRVEDVFQDIDPAPQASSAIEAGRLRPIAPQASVSEGRLPSMPAGVQVGPRQPLTNLSQVEEWSGKKSGRGIFFIIVLLIIGLGGVSFGAYYFLTAAAEPNENIVENSNIENENVNQLPDFVNTNTVPNSNAPIAIPSDVLIDRDGDGLTDLEEQSLGTDPNNIDTDGDGLSDRDEYHVYKTNPLIPDSDNDGLSDRDELFVWGTDPNNPDTDGDGFLDGAEVEAGYNPNGPGRIAPNVQN